MTKQEENITWEYEDCDNGCIIRDLDDEYSAGSVAIRDFNLPNCNENILRLLGGWLHDEISFYLRTNQTSKVKVSIKIEDNE